MNIPQRFRASIIASLLVGLALCPRATLGASHEILVIEGARLIDGTGRGPVENAEIVIKDGKIVMAGKKAPHRFPSGARLLRLNGLTIIPALIDLHTHLGQTKNGLEAAPDAYSEENVRAQLQKLLRYGVGTIISLGADQDLIDKLRAEQRAGRLEGARFYTAGLGFGVVGGYPPGIARPADVHRPRTAQEARRDVRELARHRPDFVKIWVDDDFGRLPKTQPEIYRAIIEEAHRQHTRVLAHVFYLADAQGLVQAGVDALAHSVRDQPVNQELIDAMKSRGVLYIPTLVRDESTFAYADGPVWLGDSFFRAGVEADVLAQLESAAFQEKFRSNPDLPRLRAAFEMGKKNLRTLFDAGVKIGFGTDAGPPQRFQGYFEHRELQLMVEAGLTPMQAIVCATRNAGEFLGGEVGTLEPGRRADFLVLGANPLDDIHNTEKLSAVWQAGQPLKPLGAR